MWHRLPSLEKQKYLKKWLRAIVYDETPKTLKRHIVHHAKEIYEKNPEEWLASMYNLIESFEIMHRAKPSVINRLKKLEKKYKTNPRRYTAPPRI